MKYKLSKAAEEDIADIWRYTLQRWSQIQADIYYNLLIDKLELIASNPDVGINVSHIRAGYYRLQVKSHFIFYRLSVQHEVEIIRVLDQKMDYEHIL